MAQIAVPVLYKTVIYNKMTYPIGGGNFPSSCLRAHLSNDAVK